jgi:hypothetical protein
MLLLVPEYGTNTVRIFSGFYHFCVISGAKGIPVRRHINTFKKIAFALPVIANEINLPGKEVYRVIGNIPEISE